MVSSRPPTIVEKPPTKKKKVKSKPNFERKERYERKIFIVKPENESQGKGIYLCRFWDEIDASEKCVAQQYIDPPYLLGGLKFDLRIYVLLYGINPMKLYLFEDGLARFATTPYVAPKNNNLKNMFMHLTNYAINKESDDYKKNDNRDGNDSSSHKRSLK